MSAHQYIVIGGVTPSHNMFVEILIPTTRLLVLPFHTYEGCVNYLILGGALFSMQNMYKELIINSYSSPMSECVD